MWCHVSYHLRCRPLLPARCRRTSADAWRYRPGLPPERAAALGDTARPAVGGNTVVRPPRPALSPCRPAIARHAGERYRLGWHQPKRHLLYHAKYVSYFYEENFQLLIN